MGDELYQYATTGNNLTTGSFNIRDALDAMGKLQAKDAVRKSRSYFDFLGSACGVCGESVEYHEHPERIVVCAHVWEEIKRISVPPDDTVDPAAIRLTGLRIDLKGK